MRKLPLFFSVYFVLTFSFAQTGDFNIEVVENTLSIKLDGQERLRQGTVKLKGVDYTINNVRPSARKSKSKFDFISKNKKAVGVEIKQQGNVLLFSLSPNKNNSPNGHQFSGLFFDIPGFQIGTSLWRYGESKAWTKPVAVDNIGSLDTLNIQFFYWKYKDGLYGVAMPLGGQGFSSSLAREGKLFGSKALSLVNNLYPDHFPIMAVAFGTDIYEASERVVAEGMIAMGYPENVRKKKTFPSVFENFGWCTWDAFGHKINEQKVLEGVASFTKNNFPVPMVLIDDGWLQVGDDSKLKSLSPDPAKFPQGFMPLVQKLKTEYGVKNVGIWHTINAYWKGVDSTSSLGKDYKEALFSYRGKLPWSKDTLKTFYCPTPTSEKGMQFFDDWYRSLSASGISFIKVDNQLVVNQISDSKYPLWNTGNQLQKNFQVPAKKYFNGNVINCMEMSVDDIYHFGTSAIARASDDYMPKEISYNLESGNAAVHILNCLYNSLWLSNIVWPDYDMFESYQLYPEYHAIARAISGGPVYVSDWPGEQNFDVLRPLVLKNGRVLRTDEPAQLTEDCLFQIQKPKPLKAFSFVQNAAMVGIWNASNASSVHGYFSPSDVKGLKGERFIIYEHFSKKVQTLKTNDSIPLNLTRMDYRLFSVIPLESSSAIIGLINKYNSPKTILKQSISDRKIEATLAESGPIALYTESVPREVRINGEAIGQDKFSFQNNLLIINVPETISGEVTLSVLM
jgi:raffinose synthase